MARKSLPVARVLAFPPTKDPRITACFSSFDLCGKLQILRNGVAGTPTITSEQARGALLMMIDAIADDLGIEVVA